MSCSAIASEFSAQKFRLVVDTPSIFGVWRHTCCGVGRSYYVYRVLFASLIFLLTALDFLWIIGFDGAGDLDRISACLDGVQLTLVALTFAYALLAHSAASFWFARALPIDKRIVPYKCAWLLYTCSTNAVFVCMIVFWASGGWNSSLEQQLKNSIPGCLVLLDLCLTSVPFYFCHFIYVILFYFFYLSVAALIMLLAYTFGLADKNLSAPSTPTALIAGYPLLPKGYEDFSNVHHIMITLLGCISLALIVHSILLCVITIRDFFSSLFHVSTDSLLEIQPLLSADDPYTNSFTTASTPGAVSNNGATSSAYGPGPTFNPSPSKEG